MAQLVGALVCNPVGWCRVRVRIRSRSYNRNIKIRVGVNCHLPTYIHYITVALLNNSVELSSNLNPEPLKSGLTTPLLTQSFELLSGSIGWGAGLQSSRLVQSKSSNPLKVL